jgi:hypothetical protein
MQRMKDGFILVPLVFTMEMFELPIFVEASSLSNRFYIVGSNVSTMQITGPDPYR